MSQYVFFLGSNPALSATEIVRVVKHKGLAFSIVEAIDTYLTLSLEQPLPDHLIATLGGCERIAEVKGSWNHVPSAKEILEALSPLPEKWMIGLSSVNADINFKQLANDLKRGAKAQGSRLKFVLPQGKKTRLNAAQVLFNSLYKAPNGELTIIKKDSSYTLTKTTQVQDIQAYEKRDTARPARDPRVGMLPPKLAQIMVNMAVSELPSRTEPYVILDPFCGMGTVLQEGWLMGYKMLGTDISKNMADAAAQNLNWVHQKFEAREGIQPELLVHDAQQPFPDEWNNSIDALVAEPFLGTPLSKPLPESEFSSYIEPLLSLYKNAFTQAAAVLKKDASVLFILPVVRVKTGQGNELTPLPVSFIDEISKSGYSMVNLLPPELDGLYNPSSRGTIIYGRPDANVAREVTLWKKQ